jgi:hypothetical protein
MQQKIVNAWPEPTTLRGPALRWIDHLLSVWQRLQSVNPVLHQVMDYTLQSLPTSPGSLVPFLAWLAPQNHLCLAARSWSHQPLCQLCKLATHFLFDCRYLERTWAGVAYWLAGKFTFSPLLGVPTMSPRSRRESSTTQPGVPSKGLVVSVVMLVCWNFHQPLPFPKW